MGEVDGLMGAMRGKVPVTGVWRGDAGEFEPESDDESEPEPDSERRRPPMGMGSECGTLLFSLAIGARGCKQYICD